MERFLSGLNRIGGKLFFRAVSLIPIVLLIVLLRSLIESFNQQAFYSVAFLIIPIVLLGLLVRYLWSKKRSVADIIEANS